jgi:hypothetical protein
LNLEGGGTAHNEEDEMANEIGTQAKEQNVRVYQMSGEEVEITVQYPTSETPLLFALSNAEAKALMIALARVLA